MKDTSKKLVKHRLVSIQIIEVHLSNLENSINDMENSYIKDFSFEIKINQSVNIEKRTVCVEPNISIFDLDQIKHLGSISIACYFEFEKMNQFFDKVNNFIMPQEYSNKMNSISLSTLRGIMFSELKGTHLKNAILPLVDITDFKIEKIIPPVK